LLIIITVTIVIIIPEIIIAKKAVVLSLFDGDVDCSSSGFCLYEVPDADGLVGG